MQLRLVADDEQCLVGVAQQVEELAGRGARVDVAAVGEERDPAGAADGVEQADAEACAQRVEQLADSRDREAVAAQMAEIVRFAEDSPFPEPAEATEDVFA